MSMSQIREMRKKAGLPGGLKVTLKWLSDLKKSGLAKAIEGFRFVDGKTKREIRYRLL